MRTMTEEFVERTRKEGQEKQARMVKAAMGKLHFNFEQACDFLEVPMEDRPKLEKMTEEFMERARKEELAKAEEELAKAQEEFREVRKSKAKMLKAGMKNFNVSFEQICDITEIPVEDRPELKKLIDSM